MDVLSDEKITARKEHRCNFCGGVIHKREKYRRQAIAEDGSAWTWKSHAVCDAISYEIIDRYEDGITEDYFQEQVADLYRTMFGHDCDFSQEALQKLLDGLRKESKETNLKTINNERNRF